MLTRYATAALCPDRGQEQHFCPPPIIPALQPRPPGVLACIEYILGRVKRDDDAGFGVRRDGGKDRGGPVHRVFENGGGVSRWTREPAPERP